MFASPLPAQYHSGQRNTRKPRMTLRTIIAILLSAVPPSAHNGAVALFLAPDPRQRGGRGEFLGMWRFTVDGGGVAGPMIVGQLAQVAGLHLAPVVIGGIGLLGAALLGGLVPETLRLTR